MKAKRLLSKYDGGCANHTCPAVIESEDGNFLIIGKKPTGIEDLKGMACINDDEQLVVVPRIVILEAMEKLAAKEGV